MSIPDGATVFLLHFLGGSGDGWAEVRARLDGAVRCVTVDLPGFGDSAAVPGYSVEEMAAFVAGAVRAVAPKRWFLAGHSMGAKVAAVLARHAADGVEGLDGLAGVILLAGSPPAPEPMAEERRQDMMTWFAGTKEQRRGQAERFIDANVAAGLAPEVRERLVVSVLRAEQAAWVAWLRDGSREDWAERVGTLPVPALVLAGGEDEDLGPDTQRDLVARHFAQARVEVLAGCKHLLPSEAPDEVAALIAGFVGAAPVISPAYAALIDSPRVDAPLRRELWKRAAPDDPGYRPRVLDATGLATLRAVAALVLPGTGVDWAARLDASLAEGAGDGWRFADLPPDAEAYGAALDTLDSLAGGDFAALEDARAHAILERVAAEQAHGTPLSATQMAHWLQDVCADLARRYAAHPATLARMGYSGIASGGDAKEGFERLVTGERESWEPAGVLP